MASVMCLHFNLQVEDILEHSNGKYHLCTLSSACRPLCNIGMHLITPLNIYMPNLLVSSLECQVTLMR